jgi:hypothetical protein
MKDPSVKIGSVGGTFFTLLFLPWTDIGKTIILSATGAAVSFFISYFLRRLMSKNKDA